MTSMWMHQKSIELRMISPLHFLDWVFLGFDAGVVRNVDRTICFFMWGDYAIENAVFERWLTGLEAIPQLILCVKIKRFFLDLKAYLSFFFWYFWIV